MKNPLIYIVAFLLFSIFSFILLSYEKEDKLNQHLQNKTAQYIQNYNALYHEHKRISSIIFLTKINTDEVTDIFKDAQNGTEETQNKTREKLYEHLRDTYAILKNFNIRQLHFHTKTNESFLRFHRPKLFGDNLSGIRDTVEYVNRTKKPIDGFEEGKVYNGYRFVFPMFHKDEHIGSVEISFNTLAMNLEFMNDYNVISNFLILKSVVDNKLFDEEKHNYIDSPFKNFYVEKKMLKSIQSALKTKLPPALTKETVKIINKRGEDPESFSFYDKNINQIMTLIKVKNPINKNVVGIFIVRSSTDYVRNKEKNFYFLLGIVNLFIALVLFFLYKEMRYRAYIEQSNEKLQESRQNIISLNNTLKQRVEEEVLKNRKKDEHMFKQSRMAQMGELISMIAHQWRQPLSAISSTCIDIRMQIDLETFDMSKEDDLKQFQNYLTNSLNNIDSFVQGLSSTINDFRNFYKPNKESFISSIRVPLDTALKIIMPTLSSRHIEVAAEYDSNKNIELYTNEIVQVFLNILKNAHDNFVEKEIKNAKISIVTKNTADGVIVEIQDNGGGIDDKIIEKIFDPYFSTKDEKNGTGLGLYMSKIIVQEHHLGKLNVENREMGACFCIELGDRISNEKK